MIYQRYVDADLAKVGPEVALEARYGEPTYAWALVAGRRRCCSLPWRSARSSRLSAPAPGASRPRGSRCPRSSRRSRCWACCARSSTRTASPAPQMQELATSIQQLERHYFAGSNEAEPDLKKIAEAWVARAS